MRVLVIGGGGREHALAWGISRSTECEALFVLPGNGGMGVIATCLEGNALDPVQVVAAVQENGIDFVVVGPEAPLCDGLADILAAIDIPVFGPSAKASQAEASKVFTKEVCAKENIATGAFRVFDQPAEALAYLENEVPFPCVIKADGLAAGKGVIIAEDRAQATAAVKSIMADKAFGDAGNQVVIEEFLRGIETSLICLADGEHVVALASSKDHKQLLDGDKGPNTGGMGVYSPNPHFSQAQEDGAMETIVRPFLKALHRDGASFRGCFYAGLMLTDRGPELLEVNVRFGDPETECLIPRMKSDVLQALYATATGTLSSLKLEWDPRPAVTVILASGGYPGSYEKGKVISGVAEANALEDVVVFHAGTKIAGGQLVTNGGRVLAVTALGDNQQDARTKAYAACDLIQFEGKTLRTDIGAL